MKRNQEKSENTSLSIHRIEALFDGTFAIVMTLLLLDIKVPENVEFSTSMSLVNALSDMHVTFVKYLTSFFILASVWINNNYEFHSVKKTDKNHLWLCLTGLFFIVLIPFTTSLQNEYSSILFAEIVFHANMFFIQFLLFLRWRYLSHHQYLLDKEKINPESIQSQIKIVQIAMMIPLLGLGMTFIIHDYSNLVYFIFIFLHVRKRRKGS